MRASQHGEEEDEQRAVTHYAVIDKAPPVAAWVSLKPVTGRQHQLRATWRISEPRSWANNKYGGGPRSSRGRCRPAASACAADHLSAPARRHVDVSAPLPAHMRDTFALFGFDPERFAEASG